jgi:hypothetical protein
MRFSDFTLEGAMETFGIEASLEPLFETNDPVETPPWLRIVLDRFVETPFLNERVRREAMAFPILHAAREVCAKGFTIYSSPRLDVDPERGLEGEVSYLFSTAAPLPVVMAPLVGVISFRSGEIEAGLGECLAQMIAASLFNQRKGQPNDTISGATTNGNEWLFLQLQKNRLRVNSESHYRSDLPRLMGAFRTLFAPINRTQSPTAKKSGKWILIEPSPSASKSESSRVETILPGASKSEVSRVELSSSSSRSEANPVERKPIE